MSYNLIKIIVEVGGIMPEIFTKHISDFDGLELLAVDTETFDMDVDDLFTTKREQYTMDVFSVCGKKGNTYYYGTFPATMFHEFYRKNGRSRWIQHNSQYDLKVFRKSSINWRELLIEDTMIMARLLGHTVGYGLKALRQTVLGLPERTKYKDVDRNNEEAYYMYAALDALDTYKLYEVFIKRIEAEALEGVYTLEKEVMFPTVDMEWNGVEVDIELVLVLKEMLQKKIQPIFEKLEKMTNYINIGSPKQLQELFFVKLGIEPKDGWITNGGKKKKKEGMELSYVDYSVGVDTLMDISVMEGEAGEIADVILEYRKYTKLLSTYIDGFIPKLQRGRIHSHLDSLGTATGRFCIAKGTKVFMPGEEKNIEDVNIGDVVYCYDDSGNLALRKVTNKWNNGIKNVAELTFKSKGNGKIIKIKSTYDHKFRKTDLSYVEARGLVPNDKMLHLTKGAATGVGHSQRVRLYFYGNHCITEEGFIKKAYFNADSKMHIHHKDGCKSHNTLDNLEVMTAQEHTSYHSIKAHKEGKIAYSHLDEYRGKFHKHLELSPMWIDKSKEELEKMLRDAKGKPTEVGMTFNIFKRKCRLKGVSIKDIRSEFGSKGMELSPENVHAAIVAHGKDWHNVGIYLGVNYYRARDLAKEYNISTNHVFVGLEDAGYEECWDLEVADFHNFIANEVCVHNCSKNINLQNIAAKEFDEETHATTRALFIAKKGRKLVTADYSQVELRTLGLISGDPSLVNVYKNNGDIHAQTARGIGIDRKAAKVVNFGVIYGMSKYGLKKALKKQAKVIVSEDEAQDMIDGYWLTYKRVRAMFTYVEGQVAKLGYVRSASGRKRRFYSGNQGDMRAANNMTIQGTAADIMKAGMVRVWRNIDPERATMVLQVHDEVTLEADEDYAEEAKKILEWGMSGAIKSMLDFPADAGIGNSWAESK